MPIEIFLLSIGASFVQRTTGFGFGIFIMTMLPAIMSSYGQATTLSGILAMTTSFIIVLALEALEEVELLLLLVHDEVGPPPDGFRPPGGPLLQDLSDAQDLRHAGDEHVEVAGEGVLQEIGRAHV